MYFKLYKQIRNRVKILKKEKIKILLFFIKEDKSLLKMLFDWDIYKLYMRDDLLNRFLNNLAKFINNIDIKEIEKKDLIKILNISANMLLTYYKFLYFNKILIKAIYKSKREKFLLSSVRILEFAIFLAFKKDKKVKEIFLDNYDVDSSKQYFFYLKDLNETLKINYFAIYKSKQTKKNKIVAGFNKEDCKKANKDEELKKKIIDNSFKSFIRTQSFEKIDINDFDHYFHLQDEMVNFYNYEKAKFISCSSGKGRSREIDRKEFITIEKDKIEYVSFINIKNIEDLTDEVKTEIRTKASSTVSPVLDKKLAILIESDILVNKPSKVEINSKFKRYMIAKAISNSIAKNNLNISKYQIPEIEHLKDFFAFLYERDKLKSDLILLQIIFNSNLEKLITGFINKHIIFRHKRVYVKYGNFFSNLKDKVNIFKKIKPEKKFYIYVPEVIRLILEDFQNYIILNLNPENLKEYVNNLENELNDFLKKSRNEFNKKIVLNMKTLPKLSFYYFKNLKKTFSINMLFAKDISKNDEARLCYCTTTQRLKSYESWILELIDMLEISKVRLKENISNVIPNEFKLEDKIGSYKVLKAESFRDFLLNLEQLLFYKKDLTKEDKINIQMVYLRYALGLLLATRDFYNSCDLSNYSKKFKILILQEKAKSIYMSKRIIPLTKESMEYIEIFQKIKQKNNIKSNSPVLLIDNKETLITKSEIKKFFFKFEKYDYVKYILYFIEHCRLNFGRHIATYYFANDDNVKEEYLDAFLGHFKMGSEDQGIFSYFNNKEYIDIIISKIEEIEQDYLIASTIFKEIS